MMAVMRCCCRRHLGGVTYLRVTDFIDDHQLSPGEYVLDRDVEVSESRHLHAGVALRPVPPISLFSDPED